MSERKNRLNLKASNGVVLRVGSIVEYTEDDDRKRPKGTRGVVVGFGTTMPLIRWRETYVNPGRVKHVGHRPNTKCAKQLSA